MKNFKQRIIDEKVKQELSVKGGFITIDPVSCDGCGVCVDACPFSAIEIKTLSSEEVKDLPFKGRLKVMIKGKDKAFINQDLCRTCALCMKTCHEFAIHKVEK